MKARERFTSARIAGERVAERDFDDLARMYSDERVMVTLGGVRTVEQTREQFAKWMAHWREYGFGVYTLRVPGDRAFIGRAGLAYARVEDAVEIELLYALMPQYWRQGYATEASRRILEIARDDLKLSELVAFTLVHNIGSRGVMEKCGFTYERDFVRFGDPHALYRIRFQQT